MVGANPLHHNRPRAGLTLIDLTATVLVLGIVAAVALPRFAETTAAFRVRMAAERIAADLRLARQDALAYSVSRTVVFGSPQPGQYTILALPHLDHPAQTYVVSLASEIPQWTILQADFGGDATVIFDGFGRPDSGGQVTIGSRAAVTQILLDADTGVVSLQ